MFKYNGNPACLNKELHFQCQDNFSQTDPHFLLWEHNNFNNSHKLLQVQDIKDNKVNFNNIPKPQVQDINHLTNKVNFNNIQTNNKIRINNTKTSNNFRTNKWKSKDNPNS